MARQGHWRLPSLAAVISTPTIRADGSILDTAGYDAQTGLLYEPAGLTFRSPVASPTFEEALEALQFLEALLGTFPFCSAADLSVALSAILTTIRRRTMRSAPLHGMDAPAAGTGKSLQIDIVSNIANGHSAAVISQGANEAELEKRLGSALLSGDGLISIDNCEKPLGGELICQALTQQSVKIRILGQSKNVEVPTNAMIFATGNNLTLVGDLCRRAIVCRLDAGTERPELRRFRRQYYRKSPARPRQIRRSRANGNESL